jgi:hypothetical protein
MAAALEDRETPIARSRPVARERVARLAGVSKSLLHSLRYRRPKTIAADVYHRLCVAVERQAEKQIGHLENEISTAKSRRLGADDDNIRKAENALEQARAFLGDTNGKTKKACDR